jgi:chemotaxis protein methyltransferase CheR
MVFCRNVMIYFDHATQRKVLERIHGVMKPGRPALRGPLGELHRFARPVPLQGKTIYKRQ